MRFYRVGHGASPPFTRQPLNEAILDDAQYPLLALSGHWRTVNDLVQLAAR